MKTCPTCQHTYPDDFSLCPRDGARLATQAEATEAQLVAGLSRRFRIGRRLGAGGMGTVFLAEQIGVGNRPVALKVLNRKLLDDPELLLRFQNEAASTGRISHLNVVTIYESGQADDGTPYIAMQFLEGESLRQVLKRRGALPLPEVADILQQTARGLNAAHKLGIIHRDIKPDNIFLTHGDEGELIIKVVDFGIAKLREASTNTMTGMVLGTPAYVSCEQASGMRGEELDARSDIYSLGVVVYEMLTGRVPFHSDTPFGYLRKHVEEDPPPFRAVAPALGLPPAVESAIMKALVKDRDQRYASTLDFARALASAAQLTPRSEASEPIPPLPIVLPIAAEVNKPLHSATVFQPPKKTQPGSKRKLRVNPIAEVNKPPLSATGFQPPKQTQPDSKRESRVSPIDGLTYRWIPPGSFQMGCSPGDTECEDDEKPPHPVTITKGFWLGQTEVTVGAYKRFALAVGKAMPPVPAFNPAWRNEQMPMVNVSWDDAQAYCVWARGRLPTEAEWEYAARAGGTEGRYGSLDEVAWYSANSGRRAHPVGEKRANAFGLFDVLGNVWEWVNDWYVENYYLNSPSQDPAGPTSGMGRVLRGGSWLNDPRRVRLPNRYGNVPTSVGDDNYGFRCVGEVFPR
jgi:serine/threonine-protein kinase